MLNRTKLSSRYDSYLTARPAMTGWPTHLASMLLNLSMRPYLRKAVLSVCLALSVVLTGCDTDNNDQSSESQSSAAQTNAAQANAAETDAEKPQPNEQANNQPASDANAIANSNNDDVTIGTAEQRSEDKDQSNSPAQAYNLTHAITLGSRLLPKLDEFYVFEVTADYAVQTEFTLRAQELSELIVKANTEKDAVLVTGENPELTRRLMTDSLEQLSGRSLSDVRVVYVSTEKPNDVVINLSTSSNLSVQFVEYR